MTNTSNPIRFTGITVRKALLANKVNPNKIKETELTNYLNELDEPKTWLQIALIAQRRFTK